MKIGDRDIGPHKPPYIVAEISGNHCGDLQNAIRLIKAAKRAGADAVKTQCYDPDSITLNITKPDFIVQSGHWRGRTLYELYQKAHTPPAWHKELYNVARSEGITIFSSVFDRASADLCYELGAPAFKIASFEIVDLPLLEYLGQGDKPIIISTGLASDKEIRDADDAAGNRAAFLHCVSNYPTLAQDARLHRIIRLRSLFENNREIGLSDHTVGIEIPVAAVALGATIIEKHLKLNTEHENLSEDSAFSVTPADFGTMVKTVKEIYIGMRDSAETDRGAIQFRRSLYCVRDIKKGEIYTTDNIRSIRPGYGLPPSKLNQLLGKKAKKDWRRGDPLS